MSTEKPPLAYTVAQIGAWGLYDTLDKVWLGNETGPVTYLPHETKGGEKISGRNIARMAATIMNARFGYQYRLQAKLYEEKSVEHYDNVTPKFSLEEAAKKLGIT